MKNAAIIGVGNLGSAVKKRLEDDYEITTVTKLDSLDLVEDQDVVVLTVKPQVFLGDVSKGIKGLGENLWEHETGQLFLSFMAGVDSRRLRNILGTNRVVRAMTTLAVAHGQGNTVWYGDSESLDDAEELNGLLSRLGRSERVQNEELVDEFTGIFGAGPGFLAKFLACFESQAAERGFSAEQARAMTAQMVAGVASQADTSVGFEEHARRVASKGGATEAGFGVFEDRGFEDIVVTAIGAACARTRQLGQG